MTVRRFTYEALPGRVVFRPGALDCVGEEVERLGGTAAFLVSGSHDRAAAEAISRQVGGRLAGRYDDVRQHVPAGAADTATAAARAAGADCLVALGGGSAIGFAKAIALATRLPVLTVPTTYSGSEMTPIWGLTRDRRKTTGRDLAVLPRTVVYDPQLTLGLPADLTAASGMNALAHCVEALYGPSANPVTSLAAEEGARVLAASLPRAVTAPGDLDARSDVLYGAYLGGSALASAGTSVHHKICHVLGGRYDLPHAATHAALLPYALAAVAGAVPDALARLGRALGAGDAVTALFDLQEAARAPTDLRQVGMDERDLDEAVTFATEATAPAGLLTGQRQVRALLEAAFHGRRPDYRTPRGTPRGEQSP